MVPLGAVSYSFNLIFKFFMPFIVLSSLDDFWSAKALDVVSFYLYMFFTNSVIVDSM